MKKKTIRLQINNHAERSNVVDSLFNAGYKVGYNVDKTNFFNPTHYVIVDDVEIIGDDINNLLPQRKTIHKTMASVPEMVEYIIGGSSYYPLSATSNHNGTYDVIFEEINVFPTGKKKDTISLNQNSSKLKIDDLSTGITVEEKRELTAAFTHEVTNE